MNLHEYQAAVGRTCATTDPQDALKLALVGLFDEVGEIAGPLKKSLWHGHDLDKAHLQEEVGDVLWYLATLCNAPGLSLTEALAGNMQKLHRRYPDGFACERSRDRSPESTTAPQQQQVKALCLHLWEVSNEAMLLSWGKTPLNQQDSTSLGEQLGHLIRFLARRHIFPIDDSRVASPTPKEV